MPDSVESVIPTKGRNLKTLDSLERPRFLAALGMTNSNE